VTISRSASAFKSLSVAKALFMGMKFAQVRMVCVSEDAPIEQRKLIH
jgi:hypothetical protein